MEQESAITQECVSAEQQAKEAGLRYVTDEEPGIRRIREGDAFRYVDSKENEINDSKVLERINKLRLPPAWENVWICQRTNGHLQATGVDSRGRKQYRYHANWNEVRSSAKFSKMRALGEVIPRVRDAVLKDLDRQQFDREKVLATVVSLLDHSYIRVGNAAYEKANRSYGLTTLRNKHVKMEGNKLKICFRGKKGVSQEMYVTNRRLGNLIKKCLEIPGQRLFQYYNEQGDLSPVQSEDVNQYLREHSGIDFTAKDFRTWGGSVEAIRFLLQSPPAETEAQRKKIIVEAVKHVATRLGNTPAVCRNYYVHPLILTAYQEHELENLKRAKTDELSYAGPLLREESLFLMLLDEISQQAA